MTESHGRQGELLKWMWLTRRRRGEPGSERGGLERPRSKTHRAWLLGKSQRWCWAICPGLWDGEPGGDSGGETRRGHRLAAGLVVREGQGGPAQQTAARVGLNFQRNLRCRAGAGETRNKPWRRMWLLREREPGIETRRLSRAWKRQKRSEERTRRQCHRVGSCPVQAPRDCFPEFFGHL